MMMLAVVLVELFTSQGCSSCPPADALLAVLDRDPNVIVLSEHVDYWNHLGWRDPYSSATFSARQQRYARGFKQDGPYTPQMVVDGRVQFVGSDARAASAAIGEAGKAAKLPITLVKEGNRIHVTAPRVKRADLWIALVRPEGSGAVSRGENAGRTLRHVAIVRSLAKAASTGTHTFELPPPEGVPWRVIAFLQEQGQGVILVLNCVTNFLY